MVSTPLKNISQLGLLFPIHGKMFQTTNNEPVFVLNWWQDIRTQWIHIDPQVIRRFQGVQLGINYKYSFGKGIHGYTGGPPVGLQNPTIKLYIYRYKPRHKPM